MTRAAIYTRISDDREGRALGVERQKEQCLALAAKLGLTVVEIYSDNDIGASRHSRKVRPSYRRMLADAEAYHFAVIVAATSSRLTREPREALDLLDLNESAGTTYEYVKSPRYDLSTAAGRKGALRDAVDDAAEADEISERVRDKLRQRREAGLPHGGQRPYGWEMDRTTVKEGAGEEAETLRWGAEQTLAEIPIRTQFGELNAHTELVHSIALEMNEADPETRAKLAEKAPERRASTNSRGGLWTHGTYRGVLLTARHAGLMPDGETPATWPEIFAPEVHRALKRVLNDPARVTTPGRAGKSYLLSGVPCDFPDCGKPMRVGKDSRAGYRTLRCYPSGHVQRRYDHLEALVLEAVVTVLRLPNIREQLADEPDETAAETRRAAGAEAARLRLLIDEAAAEHGKLGLSVSALAAYTAPLREQLTVAEKAAEAPVPRDGVLAGMLDADDPGAAFLAADTERQRAVMNLLVEVRIGRGPRGNVFNPEGIVIRRRQGS
jgi:site-specific DNA recombinase